MNAEPITHAEQQRRRQLIDRARHSTEMEGGRTTEADRADQDAWVRGELTYEEWGARMRARHGFPDDG